MKPKQRWSERSRVILILELAVVLPAAALVILSAIHLKTIQRDRAVEAAIQRDFSQVLAISEKQINQKAYELIDDARTDFPTPNNACVETLDKILAGHPYVANVFLYNPRIGMMFRAQPSRLQDPAFEVESDYLRRMDEGWLKMEFDDLPRDWQPKKGMPTVSTRTGPHVVKKASTSRLRIF